AITFPPTGNGAGAARWARPTPLALDEVGSASLPAREPPARDGLLARVEVDRVGAVRVQVAEERVLPPAEREEGHRRRDADVHPDHAGLDLVAVAAHRRARLGEDRGAVAEPARVDDADRLVQRGGADHAQDRPEHLLPGDVHLGPDTVEDGRPDVGAAPIAALGRAAVEHDLRSAGFAPRDPVADAVAGRARDDRT